ncbi:phosphoglycerate mutase-like protein [Flagelloscypha sp. PMI_526]|nr:phosphoglycerate mutase-like protein [Flagelloscypha sp. PMI_526]
MGGRFGLLLSAITMPLEIYLIRHGESKANSAGIVQGQLDTEITELNEDGISQSTVTAQYLKDTGITFDSAWTSDLKRAKKTAEIILAAQPNPPFLNETASLRETHMGEMQGQHFTVLEKYGSRHPSVETQAAMGERVVTFFEHLLEPSITPLTTNDELHRVLLVTHGGVLGRLLQSLAASEWLSNAPGVSSEGWFILNTSITIIRVNEERTKGVMTQFGGVEHIMNTTGVKPLLLPKTKEEIERLKAILADTVVAA